MIKEFEIKDILDAVNSISKNKKIRVSLEEKKDLDSKNQALSHSNQVKEKQSEVLVLDQMIE